jgi:hypothetical protein
MIDIRYYCPNAAVEHQPFRKNRYAGFNNVPEDMDKYHLICHIYLPLRHVSVLASEKVRCERI